VKKLSNALVVAMLGLAFLASQEIFSSSIQNEMDENSANLEEEDSQDDPQTSVLNEKRKKNRKRHLLKTRGKKNRRTKEEREEFSDEEESNDEKNFRNWKKKNKKKIARKRKKKKRYYEDNNQQLPQELKNWIKDSQEQKSNQQPLQLNEVQGAQNADWRNEIADNGVRNQIYASAQKDSEIILDPVVDSSKFKTSSLKVDVRSSANLVHNAKGSKGMGAVKWPHPIQEMEAPSRIVLSKNTDNELRQLAEKISLPNPNANSKENLPADKKSGIPNVARRRRYKTTPRESIKLRQELEMYRQIYAESFEEKTAKLEKKIQENIKEAAV
jgi:hypothetical protein